MKKLLFLTAAFSFAVISVSAQKTKKAPAANPMKNAIDSFSYAAGVNIAKSMQGQGITKLNNALLQKALSDVFANKKLLMNEQQCGMTLQEKLQQFAQQKAGAEKAKGEAFLAKNKTKPGVTALPNGLQYEVLRAGDGPKPKAVDTVVVHYVGTLIDGTEFDNSVSRGEPATFQLMGVIRGWTEILQLMPKGSKWKVYIPSQLGYGDQGAGGVIKPGSTLVFEIDLLDIKPSLAQ